MALPLNEMGKSSSAANCGAGIRSPAWTCEDIRVETWSGKYLHKWNLRERVRDINLKDCHINDT